LNWLAVVWRDLPRPGTIGQVTGIEAPTNGARPDGNNSNGTYSNGTLLNGTIPNGTPTNGAAAVQKALAILELVADQEGASAREIAAALDIPLSTAYRLAQNLVNADYLIHLRDERRYELGFKLHQLGLSLHRQVGVDPAIRAQVSALHRQADAAAYFAQYRGSEVVVAAVVDSPDRPRITPLDFGFHEAAHSTAFGKIMLAGMTPEQREQYLDGHPMTPMTRHTITDREELEAHLATVGRSGVAWEHQEFMAGEVCVAAGVRGANGLIVGSVAVSGSVSRMRAKASTTEAAVRLTAAQLSRYFRTRGKQDR
jgi:IclR family transcriptional regulator, acetate operon repressor